MKLLQRFNSIEGTSLLNVLPIYHQFESVMTSPVSYQFPGRRGGNNSSKQLAVKIERRLLALILDMKVWRIMIAKVHPNNNSKKSGNDRHGFLLSDRGNQANCIGECLPAFRSPTPAAFNFTIDLSAMLPALHPEAQTGDSPLFGASQTETVKDCATPQNGRITLTI